MNDEKIRATLPAITKGAKIGILGGSFDPPHLCHQLLAMSMLALEPIDQLWIMPCADHPFQKSLRSFEHRFAMCTRAFSRFNSSVQVVALENSLPSPNFTVNTLKAIKSIYPDCELFLAMGSDIISEIPKWYQPAQLAVLSKTIIFLRDGFSIPELPEELKDARIHRGIVLPDLRSTYVRGHLKKNGEHSADSLLLDEKVLQYIKNNNLYRE